MALDRVSLALIARALRWVAIPRRSRLLWKTRGLFEADTAAGKPSGIPHVHRQTIDGLFNADALQQPPTHGATRRASPPARA
jgi:hypothetical protein